jgi:hypothetical protein
VSETYDRVGVFVTKGISTPAFAALLRYAHNLSACRLMISGDIEEVRAAVLDGQLELILCWQLSNMPEAEALAMMCSELEVPLWPVAQSCSTLIE